MIHDLKTAVMAVETGSSRVEWTTDAQNDDAQNFYEKLGVSRESTKIMYRAQGDDLTRLSQLLSTKETINSWPQP